MAALARSAGLSPPATSAPHGLEPQARQSQTLPSGQCNYKDISLGTQASVCGCKRYWQSRSAVEEGSNAAVNVAESCFCVCSHHACYHDNTGADTSMQVGSLDKAPLLLQLAAAGGETMLQLASGSHPVTMQGLDNGKTLGLVFTTPKSVGLHKKHHQPSSVVARFEEQAEQGAQRFIEHDSLLDVDEGQHGLQGLVQSERAADFVAPPRPQGPPIPPAAVPSPNDVAASSSAIFKKLPAAASGLGLMLHGAPRAPCDYSPTPTVPTDPQELARLLRLSRHERGIHSSTPRTNTSRVEYVQEQPLAKVVDPSLPKSDAQPGAESTELSHQAAFHSWLQAVPDPVQESSRGTPDLTELRRYLEETRSLVEALSQVASPPRKDRSQADPQVDQDHAQNRPGDGASRTVTTVPHEVSLALQSSLERLVPSLSGLLEHIQVYPNISTSLQQLSSRVEQLQNLSFDHVAPEEFQNKIDFFEARVLELESRLESVQHKQQHQQNLVTSAKHGALSSFESNVSARSATSSARIQAAMDKLEADEKLKDIVGRLEVLESTSLPSFASPWDIEVCLLPFGRNLKGIWMNTDEDTQALSIAPGTQNSNEWTQARSRKSISIGPASSFGSHGGWSDDAICEWADATDEWLTPRACGPTGVVYKRLASRGFIRKVTITGNSARHVQSALAAAFQAVLPQLEDARFDADDEVTVAARNDRISVKTFLGLREHLIPLRKVRKSARLKFLAPSELLTPALWTAQFLESSAIMHAPGGIKRLFLTNRSAYLQCHQQGDAGWTWQKLREFPRVKAEVSSQQASQQASQQSDVRELFWAHHPAFDSLPPSQTSSFNSVKSSASQTRVAPKRSQPGTNSNERARLPSEKVTAPITPKSLARTSDRMHKHHRTMSNPHIASAPPMVFGSQSMQDYAQRRVASFENPSTRIRSRTTGRRVNLDPRVLHTGRSSPMSSFQPEPQSPQNVHRTKRRRVELRSDSDSESLDGEEPLDVLLRVAQGGLQTRQSSSEPLDVLLNVAEGGDGLTDIERRLQYSSAERDYRYRREREIQVGLANPTSDDDEEMLSAESSVADEQAPEHDEDIATNDDIYNFRRSTASTRASRLSQLSHPTFLVNPTPRLSREPVSPFKTSMDGIAGSSSTTRRASLNATGRSAVDAHGASRTDGAVAPYLTPFSAAIGAFSCAGDTQADTNSLHGSDARQDGDVWEGVEAWQRDAGKHRLGEKQTHDDDEEEEKEEEEEEGDVGNSRQDYDFDEEDDDESDDDGDSGSVYDDEDMSEAS